MILAFEDDKSRFHDVVSIADVDAEERVDNTFIPDICHGRHGRRPCKFFLAGVNFYRFNAKNWQFTV